jgi:hypothetical protein
MTRQERRPGEEAATLVTGEVNTDTTGLARKLHQRGLHVFPLDHPSHAKCIGKHGPDTPCDGERGKHPTVSWGVWAVAPDDKTILYEWGKSKYRGGGANIGIACGPSNLVVLDEDQQGELEKWCVTYGFSLPDTYTVTSRQGHRHVYFRWDHSVKKISNSPKATKGNGFAIDVRGDGGYVVAEGSQHASGTVYTGNGLDIADLPDEVAEFLLAAQTPDAASPESNGDGGIPAQADGFDPNARIKIHYRRDALLSYAGRLRSLGLDYDEAKTLLYQRWRHCEQPEGQEPEALFHFTPTPEYDHAMPWADAKAVLDDFFTRYPAGNGAGPTVFEADEPAPDDETRTAPTDVADLEDGFWQSRDSLQTIYNAALNRMCSPWAVLGLCAARVLAIVPPFITLPPLIGGNKGGSLNWFCAIAAISGGGKGAASGVAYDLVPMSVPIRNLGSGEGLVDAYVEPKQKKSDPTTLRPSVMFVADEVDNVHALGARSGTTLMVWLRMAFSGETLGSSNRQASSLHLNRHTYRMTWAVSV